MRTTLSNEMKSEIIQETNKQNKQYFWCLINYYNYIIDSLQAKTIM